MKKDKPISLMPSEQLTRRDRQQYKNDDLIAQIDALQALLTAERLKSAKLAYQLQELRNSSQAA